MNENRHMPKCTLWVCRFSTKNKGQKGFNPFCFLFHSFPLHHSFILSFSFFLFFLFFLCSFVSFVYIAFNYCFIFCSICYILAAHAARATLAPACAVPLSVTLPGPRLAAAPAPAPRCCPCQSCRACASLPCLMILLGMSLG